MAVIDERRGKKKQPVTRSAILDERNVITQKEERRKKDKILSSVAAIIPIVDSADHDFFEMRNGEYMEMVQITSKDIYSLNEHDKDHDIFSMAYLFQAYLPDVKVVPLNTPVNVDVQKKHVIRNIRTCAIPTYVPYLEKKLAELEFIEKSRTNREYFLFFYADDVKTLNERKNHLKKLLMRSNPIIELSFDKKVSVLYQLFNPNTKPRLD